jgi:hypothetical protein
MGVRLSLHWRTLLKSVNTHELAWAAGFFDGEGCTYARVRNGRRQGTAISIHIPQVHREVLDRFQNAVLGLGSITGFQPGNPNASYIWIWKVSNWRDCQAVIAMLWKHLGAVKREQYKTALTLFRSDPGWGRPMGRPYGASDIQPRTRRKQAECRSLES